MRHDENLLDFEVLHFQVPTRILRNKTFIEQFGEGRVEERSGKERGGARGADKEQKLNKQLIRLITIVNKEIRISIDYYSFNILCKIAECRMSGVHDPCKFILLYRVDRNSPIVY